MNDPCRVKARHTMAVCSLLVVLAAACRTGPGAAGADVYVYEDLPAAIGFPVDENVLIRSVDAGDVRAMRAHAWSLWAGLTAPSRSAWNGQRLPVFETWYSATEVFEDRARDRAPSPRRRLLRELELPKQSIHTRSSAATAGPGVMSFVKLNQASATFIRDNGYHLRRTLDDLQRRYDAANAPPEQRRIEPFPRRAAALKIVFWLIKDGASPQSERGLTPLPFWDPDYPPPPDGRSPHHLTWTKCVAVDPDGRYPRGSRQTVDCNGTRGRPRPVEAEVVGLDRFYTYRLGDGREVEAARTFMRQMSGGAGEQERFVTDGTQRPEIGDHIALMAMHVITKEMDDWTFQTFWWSPTPGASPHADDRPSEIRGVWANYLMCTAYSMVTPRTSSGGPHVCFNPYLETDLGPTKSFTVGTRTYPADPMAGTRSNCMHCHARAGWPALVPGHPASANLGRIANEGYLAPNDPYYAGITRTDFLWSLVFHSQPEADP
jgi:hypothetical protein